MKSIIVYIFFSVTKIAAMTDLSLSVAQSYNYDFLTGERNAFDISIASNLKEQFIIYGLECSFITKFALGVRFENSNKPNFNKILPTDNELFGESIVKYPAGWLLDPFVSANLRTQLTESILYQSDKKIVTSNFRDPVNTQQAAGFAYSFATDTSFKSEIRIGASLMQVRAENYTAATDNPKSINLKERFKSKTGIDITYVFF